MGMKADPTRVGDL